MLTSLGSLGQIQGNMGRLHAQKGVASMALLKTGLTAAALGVTAYSRVLGRKVSEQTRVPAESGTEPAASTPSGGCRCAAPAPCCCSGPCRP